MPNKISDTVQALAAVANADFSTPRTTAYVAASQARRFMAVVCLLAVADTKIVTIQFKQATDSAGTGAKVLNTATTYTASGAQANKFVAADAQVSDLDVANGFGFIAVTVSTNDAASPGSVTLFKDQSRYVP